MAIYPGSFDPITNGHIDIVRRARPIFDRVVVVVTQNPEKAALFTPRERVALVREALRGEPHVEVDSFSGLLVDYCRRRRSRVVIRGLRAVADFEFEFQLAHMNRRLLPALDTIYLMTSEAHFYVSSKLVREIASLGGDVSAFVPPVVLRALKRKFK